MSNIAADDKIEVASATRDGEQVEIETGRWTKHDKDRLYVNDGISKADKHKLHVDLANLSIGTNNDAAHEGSVEMEGDQITATIVSKTGGSETTYTLEIEVERYEAPETEPVSLEDLTEGDVVNAEWECIDLPGTQTAEAVEVTRVREGSSRRPSRYSVEGHSDPITEDLLVSIDRVLEGEE